MAAYNLRLYCRRPEGKLHDIFRTISIEADTDAEAINSGREHVQSVAAEGVPDMVILIGRDDRRCWSLVARQD